MNVNTQQKSSVFNTLLWIVSIVLLIAGVVANNFLLEIALPIRLIGWIILIAAVLAVLSRTLQGIAFLDFAKESRMELRKVTWPSRQETIQTTTMVVIIVLIMGLFMWGADSVLLWAVGWITGQRG
jgi:preprotein translocase subunit SecE